MRKAILALLIAGCLAAGGLYYWMGTQEDTQPPVFSFTDELILYKEGEPTEFLLQGVTAVDDVDGDVSDTIVVESVLPMKNEISAAVIYYAKDKSNNIAKASRRVEYRPENGLDWLEYVQENGQQEEEEMQTEQQSEQQSEQQTEALAAGSPRISLTTDRYTVQPGENYSLLSFVKEITDDKDGPDWLYHQIHIAGMHEINGAGTYELYYTVIDTDGNQSNRAKLTLTIQ